MRILVAGEFRHDWHEAAWVRALRELGHDAVAFGTSSFVSSWWARFQNRFVCGPLVTTINRRLLSYASQMRPDLIVCYRNLLVDHETLHELRSRTGAKLICYQNDNIFGPLRHKAYWRRFRAAVSAYDLHLAYRNSDVSALRVLGARNVVVLQPHYLPWLHKPVPLDGNSEWLSDVGFFGHCEPDVRIEQLDHLMRQVHAKYHIRGALWQKFSNTRPWKQLQTDEVQGVDYVKAINGARIALAFLSTYNLDEYTRRSFEIPACGSFMLSQRTSALRELYTEDLEAVFFSSSEELASKVQFYLANEPARLRIAKAGHHRCISSGYDVHSRMNDWLRHI